MLTAKAIKPGYVYSGQVFVVDVACAKDDKLRRETQGFAVVVYQQLPVALG